jgi:hypothetical protein
MASIICSCKTNSGNKFYRGSGSDISGKESSWLDEALSVVTVEMMAAPAEMAAQVVLVVMAALAASRMAAIRLSVQGVAAGGEDGMSAWLAGQAVLPAQGAAAQVG